MEEKIAVWSIAIVGAAVVALIVLGCVIDFVDAETIRGASEKRRGCPRSWLGFVVLQLIVARLRFRLPIRLQYFGWPRNLLRYCALRAS